MVVVRALAPDEWRQLRSIRLAALHHDPTAFARTHEEEAGYESERWQGRAAGGPDNQNFVATEGDVFVGLVAAHRPTSEGPTELVSMWVSPEVRGRGVGRLLVEAVISWAADFDPPSVELWVTNGNRPAIGLYESCGFSVTEDVQPSPADPCREETRMRRD